MDQKQFTMEDVSELEQKYRVAKSKLSDITYPHGYPIYPEPIKHFFFYLAYWENKAYVPSDASQKAKQIDETTSLLDLRSILTFFMRSERFSDGSWKTILESDHIDQVIKRLKILLSD